jgi:hypothetical protein
MSKKFNVTLSGNYFLDEREIWLDGDAPANPTPEDVAKAMAKSASSLARMLHDWNMEDDLEITIVESNHAPTVWQIADLDSRMRIRVR